MSVSLCLCQSKKKLKHFFAMCMCVCVRHATVVEYWTCPERATRYKLNNLK